MTPAREATARAVEAWATVVAREPDALAGAIVAHAALGEWDDAAAELRLARTAAIRRALKDGWTFNELADALGVSRQRVQQLAELPPRETGGL